MFNLRKKQHKGFTLIETLIAILIFSVSIVALITITSTGSADGGFVKKKQTAYLLSQEGVELVRYIRDSIMRQPGSDWTSFLSTVPLCVEPTGCNIDTRGFVMNNGFPVPVVSCLTPSDCQFYYDDDTSGFYTHDPLFLGTGVPTDLARIIQIEPLISSTEEARVTSTVTFRYGGRDFQVQLEEIITGWVSPPITQ